MNSIAWAPHEFGLALACASSDGTVSVLTWHGATDPNAAWQAKRFSAHPLGVNAVSWGPVTSAHHPYGGTSLLVPHAPAGSSDHLAVRLVTGGCDNLVKIWVYAQSKQQGTTPEWHLEHELRGHEDWVRDVQWAPSIGLPGNTIASASQVRISSPIASAE